MCLLLGHRTTVLLLIMLVHIASITPPSDRLASMSRTKRPSFLSFVFSAIHACSSLSRVQSTEILSVDRHKPSARFKSISQHRSLLLLEVLLVFKGLKHYDFLALCSPVFVTVKTGAQEIASITPRLSCTVLCRERRDQVFLVSCSPGCMPVLHCQEFNQERKSPFSCCPWT
jgi:hypothetical protein